MGALLVASVSSFTSCKDYDDDINGLKTDVEKRALQSDLTALQTTVAGVKTTAEQALEKANAAATATDLAGVKTDLAAVKATADKAATDAAQGIKDAADAKAAADAAQKAVDDAKAALGTAMTEFVKTSDMNKALEDYVKASALDAAIAKLQKEIDDLETTTDDKIKELKAEVEKFKAAYGEMWNAVSEISLYYADTEAVDDAGNEKHYNMYDFSLIKGRVLKTKVHFTALKSIKDGVATSSQTGVFGAKDYFDGTTYAATTSKTFTDGEYFNFPSEMIVRVSPTNAELKAEQLKFVDSQGNDISSVVAVQSVAPYTGVLTRSNNASGLWTVKLALVGNTLQTDLYKQTKVNGWQADKRYAIAVCNTQEGSSERYAVSEYDILFKNVLRYVGYQRAKHLKIGTNPYWHGNDTPISKITNRVKGGAGNCVDYYWDVEPTDYSLTASNAVSVTPKKAEDDTHAPITVANGDPVFLNFDDFTPVHKDAVNNPDGTTSEAMVLRPKYVYVIRDDKNANVTNNSSEINAWNHYSYTGLNQIFDLDETPYPSISVTISDSDVKGDEVAFRAFIVNYDGTLVDPDGVSFNVFVGHKANAYTIDHTFTALKEVGQVFYIPFDGSKVVSNVTDPRNVNVKDANEDDPTETASTIKFVRQNWFTHDISSLQFVTTNTSDDVDTKLATKWADVKYVRVILDGDADNDELCNWPDNEVASYTFALASSDGKTADFYINLNVTKALPTADYVKTLYTWKEGQLNGGVWNAVIYPETAVDKADAYSATYAAIATPWKTTTFGYKGINNGINGLVDFDKTTSKSVYKDENFVFQFANSVYNGTSKAYTDTKYVPAYNTDTKTWSPLVDLVATPSNNSSAKFVDGYILNLAKGGGYIKNLIDNTTEHASKIGYNFGLISSNASYSDTDVNDGTGAAPVDYVVWAEDFKTVYVCPFQDLKINVLTYKDGVKVDATGEKTAVGEQKWNTVVYNDENSIGYGMYNSNGKVVYIDTNNGISQATIQKLLTVTSKYGAEMVTPTLKDLCTHINIDPDKTVFISNGKKTQDYFYVNTEELQKGNLVLIRKAGTNDPTKDIESTLKIVGTCAYGHTHTFEIPFTVKTTAQ